MTRSSRSPLAWILAACLSLLLTHAWQAANAAAPSKPAPVPDSAPPAAESATAPPAMTEQDLGTFFDGLVPFALRRDDVAGGVIAVVKDGNALFARGYGLADLKSRAPMSPKDTLVRPGSISKLFTWTAVMQLSEQGKVNLDHDINEYLDFRIPPYQGKPVTLRNLLTHTAGFEEVARDLLPLKVSEVGLERYLKSHVPARIFPPGDLVAYSNYGCGLAGYIVQRVSGERFEDYIAHHIFEPLGMTRSSFAQPLPAPLAALMSGGYKSVSDGTPQPYEWVNPAPAGSLATTAMDMTRFMIAQLHGGQLGDARILQQATADLMHSRQYTPAPGIPGFDLGFYQEDRNGLSIIGHGGDTVFFHSDLHLLPEKDLGIFMSFNSGGSPEAGSHLVRRAVFDAFMSRYFPQAAHEEPALPTAAADAARVAGWYIASRRNESALRWLYFMTQARVTAQPDATITVAGFTDYAGKPLVWRETGPLAYREVNGDQRLSFVTRPDSSIRYLTTTYIPAVEVFERVPGYKSLSTVGWLAGIAFVLTLGALLSWPLGAMLRRHYGKPLTLAPEVARSRQLSRLGVLTLSVCLVGWVILLAAASADERVLLSDGIVPWLYVLYALGALAVLGTLAVLVHAGRTLYQGARSPVVRVGEGLLGLSVLYLVWFLVSFGMLSFSVRF